MIRRVVKEFERRSVHLSSNEEDQIRQLLLKYEPVLRFRAGERFFPMSAILYLLFSTIWYIPLQSRNGGNIVDSSYKKRGKLGLFELLRSRPHIQLNTEVDWNDFDKTGAGDRYVRMQHAKRKLAADNSINQARRILETRIRRFRSAWLNPGMLFLHFSETISPWDKRPLRHWFLPSGSDVEARNKYDELTLPGKKRDVCYYGRVVDQCGYRIVQYWFFYAFNDFRTTVRGMNNHEGDWENVSIYLAQEDGRWQPRFAVYSGHHDNQPRPWEEIEFADEAREHPVIYVGHGSHAAYFERGVYPLGVGPFRVSDHAQGDGEEIGPGKWGTPRILTETGPDWLFFDGFWGAYIRDLSMRENAPRGPLYATETGLHRPKPRKAWYNLRRMADLDCRGGPTCNHELHGYYSYLPTGSAWQQDWGTDEEWDDWAKGEGLKA